LPLSVLISFDFFLVISPLSLLPSLLLFCFHFKRNGLPGLTPVQANYHHVTNVDDSIGVHKMDFRLIPDVFTSSLLMYFLP